MLKNTIMTLLAVVAGYAVMVLLITLVQEVWFGGVAYGTTPTGRLAAAGLLTMVAAFIGAVVATVVIRRSTYLPALIMSCLVALETTALVVTGRVGGPLWFDILSALLLVLAILGGAWAWLAFGKPGVVGGERPA